MTVIVLTLMLLLNQSTPLVEQHNVEVKVYDMDVYVHGLTPEKRYTYGSNPELIEKNILSILNMNFVYDHIIDSGLEKDQAFKNAQIAISEIELDLDKEFIQKLKLDPEEFESNVRHFLLKKEYFARMRYWIKNDVETNILDDLAKDNFLANRLKYTSPEKRNILMITLDRASTTNQQAQSYLEKLLSGQDFAELAQNVSVDASVSINKGDLDWFSEAQFKYPFSKDVFLADKGVVPNIFTYKNKMYLIAVNQITPSQKGKYEDYEAIIKSELLPGIVQQKIQGIINSYATVDEFTVNKNALEMIMKRYLIFKEE